MFYLHSTTSGQTRLGGYLSYRVKRQISPALEGRRLPMQAIWHRGRVVVSWKCPCLPSLKGGHLTTWCPPLRRNPPPQICPCHRMSLSSIDYDLQYINIKFQPACFYVCDLRSMKNMYIEEQIKCIYKACHLGITSSKG